MDWKVIEEWIIARATETSTWVGFFTLVTAVTGYAFAPEFSLQITTAATGLAGVALVAMKQKGSK